MPDYTGHREADVAAPPEACFAAMTDFERMPEWQRAVKRVTLLESADGVDVVEYEIDAKVRPIRYRLRQCYEEPRLIDSAYLDGPFRDFSGRWTFEAAPDGGTHAAVEIHLDPGRWVPGRLAKVVENALLGRAIEDLKRHVEDR